jgi:hypothetical protein
MELKDIIKELLNSKLIENEELATTLLQSDEISYEDKRVFIENFIKDYKNQPPSFWTDENKELFRNWVKLYFEYEKKEYKNRVNKIE